MKLLLKILFFLLAIFQGNIVEAKSFDFNGVVPEKIFSNVSNSKKTDIELQDVFFENDFANTCKSGRNSIDYRNLVIRSKATAAKTSTGWDVANLALDVGIDLTSVGAGASIGKGLSTKYLLPLAERAGWITSVTGGGSLARIGAVGDEVFSVAFSEEIVVTATRQGSKGVAGGIGLAAKGAKGGVQATESVIKGFTGHATNQAITRGFKTADILKIVREGMPVEAMGRYGSQMRYTLGGNTVVVNAQGKVVTLYSNALGTANGLGKGFFIPFK